MPTPSPVPHRNLLSALPEELAIAFFAKARPVRLAAGRTLFEAGEAGNGCYRIEQGLLKVTLSVARNERILAILGAGSVVGELSLLDAGPRSAGVAAIKDSELKFVSRLEFEAFTEQHPEIYKHLVQLLAQRLRAADAAIAAGSFLALKGRVARALLDLAEAFGHEIDGRRVLIRQKISQSDLAAMAGIARENVSRIINDWKRAAAISRLAGYYCLEDRALLEREAGL